MKIERNQAISTATSWKLCSLLRRIPVCLLVTIMLFASVTANAEPSTQNKYTIPGANGNVEIWWGSVAWQGSGQCWAYARLIYEKIWRYKFSNSFESSDNMLRNLSDDERRITTDNTKNFISQAPLGSSIRIASARRDTDPNEFSHDNVGGALSTGKAKEGHNMIIVAKSSSGFTYIENRSSGRNEQTVTWSDFASKYATKYIYFKYIKYPNAPAYTPYTVLSKADDYYTASGILPDPSASGLGFTTEPLYSGGSQIPTYVSPYTTSSVARQRNVISYFHAVENIRNRNGEEWVKLDDGTFVKKSSLVFQFKVTSTTSGLYSANQNTQWGKAPFDAKHNGVDVANGTQVNVVTTVENKYGNIWYEIESTGSGKWVYSGHFSFVRVLPTLNISGSAYPSGTIKKGKSFNLKGTISSNETITLVKGSIIDRTTNAVVPASSFSSKTNPAQARPNSTSFTIDSSAFDRSLKFGELPDGIYTYLLEATTSSGYSKVLVNSDFTVGNGVSTIPVSSITLSTTRVDLTVDQQYQLIATIRPDNATNPSINWQSSNTAVATVSSGGKVTAVSSGNATITARSTDGSGVTASASVYVTPRYTSIAMDSAMSIEMGKQGHIQASMGSVTSFTWSSSNTDIVKVNSDGYVYGNKPGVAVITATAADGNTSGTCTVTVGIPASSSIESINVGNQISFMTSDSRRSRILSFTPSQSCYYVFESRYDNHDTYGYIYDSSWNCLSYDDDGAGNGHFRINQYMQAGKTYYLVARMYDAFLNDVLTIGLEKGIPQQSLTLDTQGSVDIVVAGDEKFFTFTPAETGMYLFSSSGECDTFGYLYQSNWTVLAQDDDSGDNTNFAISYELTANTTYYLGARLYSQTSTGTFSVCVGRHAPLIGLNSEYSVSISSAGSYTYFSFVPDETTSYVFSSTGSVDTYGHLYNSNWGEIAHDDDGGDGNNFSISTTLNAGATYYLGARLYSSSNTGSFTVRIEKETSEIIDTPLNNPDFTLPTSLRTIEAEAFSGIAAKRIRLPDGLTSIGANAFANCPNLIQIYIPEGCESIETTAFSGVTELTIYGVDGSYAEWFATERGFGFVPVNE